MLSEILKISDSGELKSIKRSKSFLELQKSGKVADRLDRGVSRSANDIHIQKDQKQNVHRLSRKIADMTKEIEIKNAKIIEQQQCICILEDALRENNNITEFEQLLAVVRSKDERINVLEQFLNKKPATGANDKRIVELEDALKESFMIAAERERVFYDEEQKRIETLKKMKKLEQRILSLQNASIMSCSTCCSVLRKMKIIEESYRRCERNRREVLTHLAGVIQDLLEGEITERDTRIAELEIKGVLDESETKHRDLLKSERDKLLNRLKVENERILSFDKEPNEVTNEDQGLIPVLTLADDLITADDNEEDIPATVL